MGDKEEKQIMKWLDKWENSEFRKKYNPRSAPCCGNCECFTRDEKEIEYTAIVTQFKEGNPEKWHTFLGDCRLAKEEKDPYTRTSAETICDAYVKRERQPKQAEIEEEVLSE